LRIDRPNPFCLPFLLDDFELSFDRPITIIAGENGTGKSTLLEGIAVLAGYDEAGGGKGYRPVDHSDAVEVMGGTFQKRFAPAGCPKLPTAGFSVPRVSFRSRDISTRRRTIASSAAGFPFAFARRRFSAVFRGALPATRHLHL